MSSVDQKIATISLDTADLKVQHVRLIRSIVTMLGHVLSTDDEAEYFDGSAELMSMIASAIKQAKFSEELSSPDGIPYAQQAIEFSMDSVAQKLLNPKGINFDN